MHICKQYTNTHTSVEVHVYTNLHFGIQYITESLVSWWLRGKDLEQID